AGGGRGGLGGVPRERKPPTTAITAQFFLSVLLGFILPWWLGPMEFFIFSLGFVLVLAVILVYIAANLGVVKYYWTQARNEFNWLLHFIFPVGTSLILIWSVKAAFSPFPTGLNGWSPIVVAIWLVLGVVILAWMKASGNKSWLSKAGEIISEREETAAERQAARTLVKEGGAPRWAC